MVFSSKSLRVLLACLALGWVFNINAQESAEDGHHGNHSDHLLILLRHKIALQKLQEQFSSLRSEEMLDNLSKQGRHLSRVMPTLRGYMATPKSYYLTTEMYHESLDNRAAMLSDFSGILLRYQKQLVSKP